MTENRQNKVIIHGYLKKYMSKVSVNHGVSNFEKIFGHLPYLKYLFVSSILNYYKTYKNYTTVIFHILKKDYPVEAILRNNTHIILRNHMEAFFLTVVNGHKEIEYDIAHDVVSISLFPRFSKSDSKIKIYGGVNNGDVSIFLDNEYKLPVKGKTVIDIGANIGDSPILFALKGAKRVIGIEPFPKNYELAKKNVESNNLSNKITLILAGCASNSSYITIDPSYDSDIKSRLTDFRKGVRVPLVTLDNILNENRVLPGDAVLKMDCEGCEYDVILSASEDTLSKFSAIQIEYHHGCRNLKKKLEDAGFKVAASRPMLHYRSNFVTVPRAYVGNLYAKHE